MAILFQRNALFDQLFACICAQFLGGHIARELLVDPLANIILHDFINISSHVGDKNCQNTSSDHHCHKQSEQPDNRVSRHAKNVLLEVVLLYASEAGWAVVSINHLTIIKRYAAL